MSEQFNIQCESCGTLFNDLQEVCPYCGEPQLQFQTPASETEPPLPEPFEPAAPAPEEYEDQLAPEAFYPPEEIEPEPFYPAPEEEAVYPPDQVDDPFVDDDIFAVAGPEPEPAAYYPEDIPPEEEALYPPETQTPPVYFPHGEAELEDEEAAGREPPAALRRFTWRRMLVGCLGLFICLGLTYGAIGVFAVRAGLQERTEITQAESREHYDKGQTHLANDAIELAIAEFEQALSLDPNFTAARQALRDAQRVAQAQPTPTSQTRTAAAAELLAQAAAQAAEESWPEAIETLSQVRDLDPDYQPARVSELLYEANYALGQQYLAQPDQLEAALAAFEQALAEQPQASQAVTSLAKVELYLEGEALMEGENWDEALDIFQQLYNEEADFLDVAQRLPRLYEQYGDQLVDSEEWCLAERQYLEAETLETSADLAAKIERANNRCRSSNSAQRGQSASRQTPAPQTDPAQTPPAPEETTTPEAAPGTTAGGQGTIYFSRFNAGQRSWQIVSVPAGGGEPQVLVNNGTMPAVSPNGQLLVYRSEQADAEGLHLYNLTTGEDNRLTIFREHILPRWGGDNSQFLFVAQELGTGRWQIFQGFADGKGDPVILRDGRTPDWSNDNRTIAYQGTNPQGNEPGIYLAPLGGGETTRLTNHESDRSPAFSPTGSDLAYMSTRNGNWDIYLVNRAGSAPRPLTAAASNEGLPAWSPDGAQLAYISDAGGQWAIYRVAAAGGSPVRVAAWDGSQRADWLLAQIWWGP